MIVAATLFNRFSGRPLDSVAVNYKRWTSQRMQNVLRQYDIDGEKVYLTERDVIELEENAENYRTAYELIASHRADSYPCPWGDTCPARNLNNIDDLTAEEHANVAYNMTRRIVEQRALKRSKGKMDIEKVIKAREGTINKDSAAVMYQPVKTHLIMC